MDLSENPLYTNLPWNKANYLLPKGKYNVINFPEDRVKETKEKQGNGKIISIKDVLEERIRKLIVKKQRARSFGDKAKANESDYEIREYLKTIIWGKAGLRAVVTSLNPYRAVR